MFFAVQSLRWCPVMVDEAAVNAQPRVLSQPENPIATVANIFRRDPLTVVRTYVAHSDPTVRRNAASALTVLASEDAGAIPILVDMLLAERDPVVIRHIETELMRLGQNARLTAVARFLEFLDDPDRGGAAAVRLGRLRLRGVSRERVDAHTRQDKKHGQATESRLSWRALRRRTLALWSEVRRRFRRLAALSGAPEVAEARRITFPFVFTVVGWAALGAAVMGGYLFVSLDPSPHESFYPVLVVTVLLFAFGIGIIVAKRATPTYYHEYRAWGGAVEAGNVGLWVSPFALIGFALLTIALSLSVGVMHWIAGLVGVSLAVCGFVAAIRVGTVVAFGLFPVPSGESRLREPPGRAASTASWRKRRERWANYNFLTQWMVGTSVGVLVANALLLVTRWSLGGEAPNAMTRVTEGLWVFGLPAASGIAAAFAAVDRPVFPADETSDGSPSRAEESEIPGRKDTTVAVEKPQDSVARWPTSLARLIAAAVLTVPLIGSLAIVGWAVWQWRPPLEIARSGMPGGFTNSFTAAPASADFRVAFPQRVRVRVPEQGMDRPPENQPDLKLKLFEWHPSGVTNGLPNCARRSNRHEVSSEDDPPAIDMFLGWGCYSVGVSEHVGEELGVSLRTSTSRFAASAAVLDARTASAAGLTSEVQSRDDSGGPSAYQLKVELNVDRREGGILPADGDLMNGVWLVERIPAERRLTIPPGDPMAVLLSMSPRTPKRQKPALPASAPEPPMDTDPESTQPDDTGQSIMPFLLSIWKDDTRLHEDPSINEILESGTYVVRVTNADQRVWNGQRLGVSLLTTPVTVRRRSTLEPLPELPKASPGQPLVGFREIATESLLDFVVEFPQTVRMRIPPVRQVNPYAIPRPNPPLEFHLRLESVTTAERGLGATAPINDLPTPTGTPMEGTTLQAQLLPGVYRCTVLISGPYDLRNVDVVPVIELELNVKRERPK